MRKPIAVLVAGVFAVTASSVFAASHTGGKMDDKKPAVQVPGSEKSEPPKADMAKPAPKEKKAAVVAPSDAAPPALNKAPARAAGKSNAQVPGGEGQVPSSATTVNKAPTAAPAPAAPAAPAAPKKPVVQVPGSEKSEPPKADMAKPAAMEKKPAVVAPSDAAPPALNKAPARAAGKPNAQVQGGEGQVPSSATTVNKAPPADPKK